MEKLKTYLKMLHITLNYYKNMKKHIFLIILLLAIISLLNSLLPFFMKKIIDATNSNESIINFHNLLSLKNIYFLTIIYSFAWLLSQILDWTKGIFDSFILSKIESSIIIYSLNDFLMINKKSQDKIDIGIFNSDVSRASDAFATLNSTLFFILLPVFLQLLFMAYILYNNVGLIFALLFVLSTILVFCISNLINRKSKKYFEPLYDARNKLNSSFLEKIQRHYDIKTSNSIDFEKNNFKNNAEKYVKQNVYSNYKIGLLMIIQVLFIFIFLFLFLLSSIYLFSKNRITSGDFVMISSYIVMLTSPFLMISQHIMLINGHMVSLNKLDKYFKLEKDHLNDDVFLDAPYFFKFNNVEFSIGDNIIENFNLTIEKNKMYVIIGKTGIGKTTLINYMLGLYKINSGNLFYKNLDISKNFSNVIFNEVSFSGQNNSLYNGTLRENLLHNSKYDFSDDILINHLEKFDLLNIITNNNLTLDSHIDEVLKTFSGGEKQRLNIIRAYLKKTDLLILDEPTSALDEPTAVKVLSFLRANVKSLIVISHSQYCIDMADEIIDLNTICNMKSI